MKLGFTAMMSNQKPSLRSGSQKRRPDLKRTASSVQCESDVDCVFYWEGVIHHEFVPRGQRVNNKYLKIMKRLRGAVRRRPDLWRGKSGRSILTTLRRMPPF
jgi:hypothetical protein